jgi:hypothetical protein
MRETIVLSEVDQELSALTSSLERCGFKTRPEDQPRVVLRGEAARHYSCGSPHPAEYTARPEWEERRQQLFRVRQKKCEHCKRTWIIQVHHRYYFSTCDGWDYKDEALSVLCKICHSLVHGYVGDARRLLREERKRHYRPRYDDRFDAIEAASFGDDDLIWNDGLVEIDPTVLFDEDNPELWRIEYIEDPEGRSDRLRFDLDEDSDDDEWAEMDDDPDDDEWFETDDE